MNYRENGLMRRKNFFLMYVILNKKNQMTGYSKLCTYQSTLVVVLVLHLIKTVGFIERKGSTFLVDLQEVIHTPI